MTFRLQQLQDENRIWADKNFPTRQPYYPLLGLMEEIGELLAALETAEESTDEINDAVADIAVYLSDYANQNGLMLDEFTLEAPADYEDTPAKIAIMGGKLCHYHLKGIQGIRHTPEEIVARKKECIQKIIWCLVGWCNESPDQFLDIVAAEWAKVKQRDWVKNPMNADKVAQDEH